MSTISTSAQVPKLRFPGFEGEWEESPIQQKLKKVIDYRGKAPPKADQGVPLITARNVRDGYLDFTADEYIEASEYEAWMSRGIPVENDVLFTTEAPLGNLALFPKGGPYALGQRIITLQTAPSECDSIFLFHLLRSEVAQQQIDEKGTGSTAKGIKSKVFVQIPLHFPSVHEQQKIAAFLTAVDGRIEQLSRNKALLEEYKKGVMQQLFTQTLRFQDDHGHDFPDWEEKTLGDVITSLDAGVSVNSEDSPAGPSEQGVLKTSCVTKGSFDPNENKRVTDEAERSRLKEPVTGNTIIISRMNTPALVGMSGFVRESHPNLFLPDRLWAAKVSPDHSAEWTAHLFGSSMMRSVISSKATGTSGSMKNITKDDVLSITVQLPSLPEQTKIAGFLSALDGKIGAVGEQMRQTQAWKKGLLQQMFV
jgi:type I restriction enzyme, S subunit